MSYKIRKSSKELKGDIFLPSSKSESNRLLVIDALLGSEDLQIENLSPSNDTKVLKRALESLLRLRGSNISVTLDMEDSGTAMRFITSFASAINVKSLITGSERMKERPLSILVDTLKEIGAHIKYADNNGFPPILVEGKRIKGGVIDIDATISSQYISSLMLVAPKMTNGIIMYLKGDIASYPYINMTSQIMQHFGIEILMHENAIAIKKQSYSGRNKYVVESDWSAASYWYEIAAFSDDVDLFLHGLKQNSIQGDSIIAKIFEQFGVHTEFQENGIRLTKTNNHCKTLKQDFLNYPDMVQTLACTAAGLGIAAQLNGLSNLRYKETDRIHALHTELKDMGVSLDSSEECIALKKSTLKSERPIRTFADHRMAMAFAPLAIPLGEITIESPNVVNKSYPGFWEDLEKMGFTLEEV
ncbi:MAG: 3-phosphoshikimate 1-carboxyvinyltransferase [Bacteroidetes bacterium 4572_77]|nr:MAG: 3-phosphoshikimate 1-carboxyvinyltransferase [Bacteroidetes bacterium 4572_77]